MRANTWLLAGSVFLWAILGALAIPAAAQVTVTSANPDTAPQGSTNMIVKIAGNGFKKGASASFLVSGTTNPGGITVNSTSYVSSTEVDANITVASDATLSGFDIYVTSRGRTGKGTDLFTVTSNPNANQTCVTQGTAAGWTLVGVLNPADSNGTPLYTAGALGTAVRVRLISVGNVPQFYVGLAGSGSGGQAVAFVLNLDGTVRRSWSVLTNSFTRDIEVGDINGDGVPDFVMGDPNDNAAHVLIGHLTGSIAAGNLDYNIDPATDVYLLPTPPRAPNYFGYRVAMGDLTGDGHDEVVVASTAGPTTKHAPPGVVYIYSFNSNNSTWSLVKQIDDPGASAADHFGTGLAVGELTIDPTSGAGIPDLAVAASDAGLVYVFQDPLGSSSLPTLSFPVVVSNVYNSHVGIGDVTGDGFPDLIAVGKSKGNGGEGEVFSGPLSQNVQIPALTFFPDSSLALGWGTGFDVGDIDGDGRTDVLPGAPNASYSSTCSPGVAYLFRTNSTALPSYSDLFEVPDLSGGGFGWSMAAAPFNSAAGQPIILVGENGAQVGTQTSAGQIYIYRKTQ